MVGRMVKQAIWTVTVLVMMAGVCAKADESVPKLTPEQRAKLKEAIGEHSGAICHFLEGLRGEWIMQLSRTSPDDWSFFAVPTGDGGLAVKRAVSFENVPVATVAPDGRISRVETIPGHRTDNAPVFWPFRDGDGQLTAPPAGTVLSLDYCEQAGPPQPPDGVFGWAYLDVFGKLTFRHRDLKQPFPNTLWLVREGKGIVIVHGGPEKKGVVFARVDDNYRITWLDPPSPLNEVPDEEADYWPFIEAGTWFAVTGPRDVHLYPGMRNYGDKFEVDEHHLGGITWERTRAELKAMIKAGAVGGK